MYNCFECFKSEKGLMFLGGIATAVVGAKILKCPKTRQVCVKVLAQGMSFTDEAKATVQNMREEAEDLYTEAKKTACED